MTCLTVGRSVKLSKKPPELQRRNPLTNCFIEALTSATVAFFKNYRNILFWATVKSGELSFAP